MYPLDKIQEIAQLIFDLKADGTLLVPLTSVGTNATLQKAFLSDYNNYQKEINFHIAFKSSELINISYSIVFQPDTEKYFTDTIKNQISDDIIKEFTGIGKIISEDAIRGIISNYTSNIVSVSITISRQPKVDQFVDNFLIQPNSSEV